MCTQSPAVLNDCAESLAVLSVYSIARRTDRYSIGHSTTTNHRVQRTIQYTVHLQLSVLTPEIEYSDPLSTPRAIEYTEIDLAKQPDQIPALLALTDGERITPVIVENGEVIIGFKGGT